MIPARIIHLDAKGSTHAPPHRAVSFREHRESAPPSRRSVGCSEWRLNAAMARMLAGKSLRLDVWLVNGQRVRVRPSAKWLEARKEMFK